MAKTTKDPEVLRLERELRRLKAEKSSAWRLIKQYEGELDLVQRILSTVDNAVAKMPEVEPPPPIVYEKSAHEEVVVLLMSDVHVGKKTKSYNPKVFVQRLGNLEHNMMSIVTAQRSIRPIRKLVLVMNGDFIDAEAVYPSQAVDHISIPIIDQIYSVGLPEFMKFFLFLLANFDEVEVYAQRGNHGRQNAAKWSSSKSTNWDFVFYKSLEGALADQPRIKWHIDTKDWKQTFRIINEGFLATHGDMIKSYYNLPFYGMTRQAMRWANAYRDQIKLNHFLFGHFHSAAVLRFNDVMIYLNGSFVTDDPYAEEHIGVASHPEQLLFAVHPKFGVTWHYKLKIK